MRLKKAKTTLYLTILALATYGGSTLIEDAKGVYATYKKGKEQQVAMHPVPIPDFKIDSPKREEYALFWNKLDKEIDRQEENRRVK